MSDSVTVCECQRGGQYQRPMGCGRRRGRRWSVDIKLVNGGLLLLCCLLHCPSAGGQSGPGQCSRVLEKEREEGEKEGGEEERERESGGREREGEVRK